jgi:hypothetical protein
MAVDLDSEQAPQLLQSLSSELADLVSSPSTPPGLSATCFDIMAQLTSALASLSGAYQKQVSAGRVYGAHRCVPWIQHVVGQVCLCLHRRRTTRLLAQICRLRGLEAAMVSILQLHAAAAWLLVD